MISDETAFIIIACASISGMIYGLINFYILYKIPIGEYPDYHKNPPEYLESLLQQGAKNSQEKSRPHIKLEKQDIPAFNSWEDLVDTLKIISHSISSGAETFLSEEYRVLTVFLIGFSVFLALVAEDEIGQFWTTGAFLVGSASSIASGFLGMKVAVFTNSRTAYSVIHKEEGLTRAFKTAYRGGAVLGFTLTSIGVFSLLLLIFLYKKAYLEEEYESNEIENEDIKHMHECIAGFGLGGSTVAMFGRVGGGIYTKAADIGADLGGKIDAELEEDDMRNPATIADNVGDNVRDIAGMGADLFGSFSECTCAALLVAGSSEELIEYGAAIYFPVIITAVGIPICMFTVIFAHHTKIDSNEKIESVLKYQLVISTFLLTPTIYYISETVLPESFEIERGEITTEATRFQAFLCVILGLWIGLMIGFTTEYYISENYRPVKELADSCKGGIATNIHFGLALGYNSCIIPTLGIGVLSLVSFKLCDTYGVALAAIGMLGNLSIALATDGYGPICDNAGGMIQMLQLPLEIKEKTDALDAAGNTTAAVGKGFAIGSAALVALGLFGAFATRCKMGIVDLIEPVTFAGLLIGSTLPYFFSAITIRSVGKAAFKMIEEVRREFVEMASDPLYSPEYEKCVQISTRYALKEMTKPALIVIGTPIVTGWLLGKEAVSGLLAGILISGFEVATASANSGGAWANAKKYIENGSSELRETEMYKEIREAAVTGDTVGDPMKDVSGPSLNILIKLSAIVSLIFAGFFIDYKGILIKN